MSNKKMKLLRKMSANRNMDYDILKKAYLSVPWYEKASLTKRTASIKSDKAVRLKRI